MMERRAAASNTQIHRIPSHDLRLFSGLPYKRGLMMSDIPDRAAQSRALTDECVAKWRAEHHRAESDLSHATECSQSERLSGCLQPADQAEL